MAIFYNKVWRAYRTESKVEADSKGRHFFGTKIGDRFQVKTFFFFREQYNFGTKKNRKIGERFQVKTFLRPASWNYFEKWPAKVKKLDHPVLEDLNQTVSL